MTRQRSCILQKNFARKAQQRGAERASQHFVPMSSLRPTAVKYAREIRHIDLKHGCHRIEIVNFIRGRYQTRLPSFGKQKGRIFSFSSAIKGAAEVDKCRQGRGQGRSGNSTSKQGGNGGATAGAG